MIPRSFLLTLFACVFATACGSAQLPVGQCAQNSDCETGQFCNQTGFCQKNIGCASSSECPSGQTCNVGSGQCTCTSDSQCLNGQVCNGAGQCQPAATCQTNLDCTMGSICDTLGHSCIPQTTCTQNVQCPQGQFCSQGTCAVGCTQDGDCQLVDYSQVPPVYQPAACINDTCVPNGCHSSFNCPTFSTCNEQSNGNPCAGGTDVCTCTSVCNISPFCTSCGETMACPGKGKCLVDLSDPSTCTGPSSTCLYYCGLDCSSGQECPDGTVCSTITALNSTSNVPGGACNNGTICDNSGDSRSNAPCPAQAEGAQYATCPCFQDSDCPGLPCVNGSCVDGLQCVLDKQYTCRTNNCGSG